MIRLLIPTGVVITLLGASMSLDGQGMASPKSEARGSDLAHTALPLPKVWFEDVGAQAGLNFRHVAGDAANKTYLVETTGSGVAIIDYDNDGLPDIFFRQ